jgi:hypothetical protein
MGEYIALATDDLEWYRVELVVHCAFEATYQVEIYAVGVQQREAIQADVVSGITQP